MPQYQHRSGMPSKPRNNDHTRWERERTSWPMALFGAAVVIFIVVGLFVPA